MEGNPGLGEGKTCVASRGTRWVLLSMISVAFLINFIDRQVLATLAPLLRDQLGFSNTDYSFMVVAFLFGMGLFQFPAGLLMDRKGPRFGLSLIVIWWSIASGLHAFARTMFQFCGLRFLLGSGECGNYAGGLKLIGQHFPSEERALAGSIFGASSFVASVIAPPLVVFLALRFSWHVAFLLPSTFGFLWVAAWLWLFPRRVLEEIPGAPSAVGATSPPFSAHLRGLLRRRQTWAVILIRGLGGPLFHFYYFWIPEYLKRTKGVDLATLGAVVWIPFLFAGLGSLFGGYVSGELLRRGHSLTFSRRLPCILGDALAIVSNLLVMAISSLPLTLVVLSVANFGSNMIEPNFVGFVTDIFPQRVIGRVTSLTGIADNIMSITLTLTTGIVLDHFSYLPVFMGATLLPLLQLASVMWLGPVKKLDFLSPTGSEIAQNL
jgi:ACS family hexuronate transporter-like MFS transporter